MELFTEWPYRAAGGPIATVPTVAIVAEAPPESGHKPMPAPTAPHARSRRVRNRTRNRRAHPHLGELPARPALRHAPHVEQPPCGIRGRSPGRTLTADSVIRRASTSRARSSSTSAGWPMNACSGVPERAARLVRLGRASESAHRRALQNITPHRASPLPVRQERASGAITDAPSERDSIHGATRPPTGVIRGLVEVRRLSRC